jgi:hypothetical protein
MITDLSWGNFGPVCKEVDIPACYLWESKLWTTKEGYQPLTQTCSLNGVKVGGSVTANMGISQATLFQGILLRVL